MSVVAIVGRPNVGKSTLFNRLVGRRVAIVENVPGVTRDRNYAEVYWEDRRFTLVDTGGLETHPEDQIASSMCDQARQAVDQADLILFLVDAHQGLLPGDLEIAQDLRRRAKDVVMVVNKVDGPRWEAEAVDFQAAGLETVMHISAEHALGITELREELHERLPPTGEEEMGTVDAVRVAVLGRPNVGKSSLVNRVLGEERLVVSPVAGTTRDAIDTLLQVGDRRYCLVDTAGIRRKSRVEDGVERWSVLKAIRAIDRAQVCLLLVDAQEGFTDQDARILNLIFKGGRGAVLCLNKWDAVDKDHKTFDQVAAEIRRHLGPHGHVPIVSMSALSGQRVARLFPAVDQVFTEWRRRVPTAEVNTFLEDAVRNLPPPVSGRKRTRLYYMTQVSSGPPVFATFTSYPEGIATAYQRYLVNRLRDTFGFAGVPVTIRYRKRSRPGDEM
jgi:GTP-binding protein